MSRLIVACSSSGVELCCRVKPWASFVTLHCSISLSFMNEYLASDGYFCEWLLTLIVVCLDSVQRS